ncbi:class I SAM-dependent methyltransferase [Luteolibacter algae]|uniref:Class I SAM-dependent methyltransferase n=1 Tax=Luteolibacter algae TaxID=454151 RepID=A0ABW5D7L9_9BACT
MNAGQMAENYNSLAKHWAGEDFNTMNGLKQHRVALQFSKSRKKAIDIGCGSSGRILHLFHAEGFETIEGLDQSAEMLRYARMKQPEAAFHEADISEWEFPGKYDFISAWDSIWHVPLELQEGVLEKIGNSLSDDGVFIFTIGGLDCAGEATNPFQGVPLYHATLGIPKVLEIMRRCSCVVRHLEYDQHPELHVYLVVQKTAN